MALTTLKVALPQSRYVSISSTNIGTPAISDRDFGGLVFTEKDKILVGGTSVDFEDDKMVEVYTEDQARSYFGSGSDETEIAVQYFGYRSPSGYSPRRLCFVRKKTDETPVKAIQRINGMSNNFGGFMFVNSESFTVGQIKDVVEYVHGLDHQYEFSVAFSKDNNYGTAVAADTSISAANAAGVVEYLANGESLPEYTGTGFWLGQSRETSPIMEFNSALSYKRGDFCFYKGELETAAKYYQCTADVGASNTTPDSEGSSWDVVPAWAKKTEYTVGQKAVWDGLPYKVIKYISATSSKTPPNDTEHWELLENVTRINPAIAAFMPLAVLGSVRYSGSNVATNYMYKRFPSQAYTVDTEEEADLYDEHCVNYIGLVQANGPRVAFTQQGYNINGEAINTYCNEVWLKSEVATALLNLFLSTDIVDADENGELLIYNTISSVAAQGINNGVISIGKVLDDDQKTAIYQLTQNAEAWRTIQDAGYYLTVEIRRVTEHSKTFYKAYYRLVYSKDDAILKVDGQHSLV